MSWNEPPKSIIIDGKVKQKAPIHRQVKLSQNVLSNPIPAPRPKEIQEYLDNPTPFLSKFSQLYSSIKSMPKWSARDDYIKLIIKQTADKSIKDRDIRNFLDYIKEAEEDSKEKTITDTDLKDAQEMGYNAFSKEIYASAHDKIFLDKFMQGRGVGDKNGMLLLKAWLDGNTKARLEEKPKPDSTYDNLIFQLNEAKTLKDVGEINQSATKAEMSGKITFEQLQKIYSLVREKDAYIIRKKETMIDVWKSIIKTSTSKEKIVDVIRETNASELLTKDQKTQFETLAKKKLSELFQEVERKSSDFTIVNDFKTKIQNATQINELNELSFQVTDNVANGNFAKAKVISADIQILHELIDKKISNIFKEKIGTTEDFVSKTPITIFSISNEINRLRELNQKVQASSLNQNRKDTLDVLIHSKMDSVRRSIPKKEVKSLDDIGKIDYEALKSKTDFILLSIADISTKAQIDAVGGQIKKLTDVIGSTNDPKIIELVDNITKLYNIKKKQIYGDTQSRIIKTTTEYEISNLKYEAEHKPPEMLPPKEYDDVSKYTWGLTEAEAIKKYAEKELKKNQSNIDFTNKQKLELEEMVKSKPHVLLTRAQIQKQYPQDAEQMLRDLWTYKTKKSDYEKNVNSARFWQSKVDKINSGEWEKINTNYLREAYQKEVKDAIKKGKPVPYDVIKQYPEFTKSQNARERYEKGRNTSFANVSIAVDTKHQENHGVKIKLQDGSAMEDKYADDIVRTLSQYQSVVGDITPILKRENVTIAHTKGKHPFLSTAAGMYHPTDITVTMGMDGVGAHELTHFLDETAKRRHKDMSLYDYQLLAFAKNNMNGGIHAVERAIALSKSKSPEELTAARELRFMLGTYWKRPEEIFARLIEQYTAFKNKELQDTTRLHYPYETYIKTPGYWDDETFISIIPQIEQELKRKIELAR